MQDSLTFPFPASISILLRPLVSPAITVAMLGASESLMSAAVSDRMSGSNHNPNVELMGQGIANIVSPLLSGLPATGAKARTATNIRAGAKTRVAGIVHSLTLLVVILFAAPYARFYTAVRVGSHLFCGLVQQGGMAGNAGTLETLGPGDRQLARH